ncbi:MAG TPA: M56 family metallopeptidase [Vicinamibacterales bacterium]|nr:M56 family metallopeptidase [Vicinamibacterales bacterium]
MILLLEAAIKIALVIVIGLIAVVIFHRRPAALRHWMLTTAIVVSLATPLMIILAPSWSLPVETTSGVTRNSPIAPRDSRSDARIGITATIQSATTSRTIRQTGVNPAVILVAIWIIGVAVNLAGLSVGLWRLRRTAVRATIVHDGPWAETARTLSERLGLRRPVRLLQSDEPALLMTWGLFTPKVLLPIGASSWHADRIRVVLAHELAHVQRGDWIVQIGSELLRSACWFNPLVWLASSRVRFEGERACDDAVVNLGVGGGEYAEHLLDLARQFGRARHHAFPAVAIVPRPTSLERRVTAMLNVHIDRNPVSRVSRLATLAVLLAAALPIALFAQNRFWTISGSIVDPSNAVLPGVTVVAIDTTRGARHQVETNRTGRFEIVGLPDGAYLLEAGVPGFATYRQKLTLDGQDVNREITLQVGTLEETISVTRGGAPPSFDGQRWGSPRPATCGPSEAAPATGSIRIGGQIRQPRKIRHVSPVYPEGTTPGLVRMEAIIGIDGLVQETKVTNDAPPALAQAAVDAVRQWEFDPTLLNCLAIPVTMTVTIDFN